MQPKIFREPATGVKNGKRDNANRNNRPADCDQRHKRTMRREFLCFRWSAPIEKPFGRHVANGELHTEPGGDGRNTPSETCDKSPGLARTRQPGRKRRFAHTSTALPFSGTITCVACPFISETNLSAFGSTIGNEP
jgi:hypothetical protein